MGPQKESPSPSSPGRGCCRVEGVEGGLGFLPPPPKTFSTAVRAPRLSFLRAPFATSAASPVFLFAREKEGGGGRFF